MEDTIYTPDDEDFTGVTVAVDGGAEPATLTATDHHPFWVENRGRGRTRAISTPVTRCATARAESSS
ncbi:hypothetical protein ACFV06_13625 [Streptomyces sp. NPDC059618]|uniref:hypothetical protein n=1 Tax=Streptomyces sp. NPDC059618 TaxID=3346887 RepID=UPI0036A46BB7